MTAYDCPRIPRDWLEAERDRIGAWMWEQEFMVAFKDAIDSFFRGEDIAVMADPTITPLFAQEVA